MTNDTISQRLESLADEIDSSSQRSADRLRSLGAALDEGVYADTWANTNLFHVIDLDTITDQVQNQGPSDDLFRVFELVRNALVFAPIAVTWMGIWHALESYGVAVEQNPDLATQSFLFLWQQGFGGRSLTLSTIALIDGILLIAVFVLTLVVLWHSNQKVVYADRVRDDLAAVLADATLDLTTHRIQQTSSLVSQFDRVAHELLTELRQERMRVHEIANQREKELSDMAAFTRDFMSGTQSMVTATQALSMVPQQLGTLLQDMTAAFQQVIDQQRDQQKDFVHIIQQAETQLHQVIETYRDMSTDMQAMGRNLQAMGTNMHMMGTELRNAIQASQHVARQNAQAVSDMQTTASHVASSQSQFLASFSHEQAVMEKGIQGILDSLQSLQHTYASLEQSINNLSRTLQALTKTK